MLAWGSWNFELVQLFLLNWIAHCFARHAWCSPFYFVIENSCSGQLEFWACTIILDQLESRLFWKARMENSWLRQLEFLACNYSSSIGLHIVLLGTHGVLPLFYFVLENSCSGQLEFWACTIILDQLESRLFCYARMENSWLSQLEFLACAIILHQLDCTLFCWKNVAWGSWNFELAQLFLVNWISHCCARHAWCSPSVLFRDGKCLLEAVGILSLCKY